MSHNKMVSSHDLLFVSLLLQCMCEQIDERIGELESVLLQHVREQRRLNGSLPDNKVRVTWDLFKCKVTACHFRRMFRMPKRLFGLLCERICTTIGEDKFRSELHLHKKFSGKERAGTNPLVSGEIKALSLRMLAGGSYLDLVPLFGVSTSVLHIIFNHFLNWILPSFDFPLVRLLRESRWSSLEDLANRCAERTSGVFFGPFAALDGPAVRIKSPSLRDVSDPGNCCCRKGFCALNVQAICDSLKRFLWCYPSDKGSTHDSAAFQGSRSLESLKEKASELHQRGLFIAGDSAHALSAFLQVPHEKEEMKGDVNGMFDSFNFHLSSCRITIECAFGELVMRWGTLWRTLLFDLMKCCDVVRVCMSSQNFVIDNRESSEKDTQHFKSFEIAMDETQQEITRQTGEMPRAVVTDNDEPRSAGRPTTEEALLREQGTQVRNDLTVKLSAYDLKRPLQHDMKCNSHGHIYMES